MKQAMKTFNTRQPYETSNTQMWKARHIQQPMDQYMKPHEYIQKATNAKNKKDECIKQALIIWRKLYEPMPQAKDKINQPEWHYTSKRHIKQTINILNMQ